MNSMSGYDYQTIHFLKIILKTLENDEGNINKIALKIKILKSLAD